MIFTPTNRRIVRPGDKPSFEHTQRHGLIKDHPLGPAGGLIFFMLANEAAGRQVLDLSGSKKVGTLDSGAKWVSGDYGPCIENTNNIRISFPGAGLLLPADAGTVECYVRPKWNYDDGLEHHLFYTLGGNGKLFSLFKHNNNDTYLYTNTTYRGNFTYQWQANKSYHIVLVWGTNQLYINGAYVKNYSDGGLGAGADDLYVASRAYTSYCWNGYIEWFRIYNRALSLSEMAQLRWNPFCMAKTKTAPIYSIVPVTYAEIPPFMHKDLIDLYASGAWLWLVQIVVPGQDTVRIARNTEDIRYGHDDFDKFNLRMGGQIFSGDGSIPRVTLQVFQDPNRKVEDIVNETEGALGAQVKLIRVNEKFLNTPVAALEFDYDNLASQSDSEWVTFTLGIPNPLTQRFPLRMYSSSMCPWTPPELFKGPDCQYTGEDTTCTGTYEDCYTKHAGNPVHWGGELGLDPSVVKERR